MFDQKSYYPEKINNDTETTLASAHNNNDMFVKASKTDYIALFLEGGGSPGLVNVIKHLNCHRTFSEQTDCTP